MAVTSGADADKLDALAKVIETGATKIEDVYTPVRQSLRGSGWQGQDADQFGSEWDGPSKARLTHTATALRDAATTLRKNAQAQRQTSNTYDGSTGTVGTSGLPPSAYRDRVEPTGASAGHTLWRGLSDLPVIGSVIGWGTVTWDVARIVSYGSAEAVAEVMPGDHSAQEKILNDEISDFTKDGASHAIDESIGLPIPMKVDMGGAVFDEFFGAHTDDLTSPGYWLTKDL